MTVGDWTLFPDQGLLRRNSEERKLTGKALHVLLVLIDAGESAVARGDLLDTVWGEHYPTDSVVSRAIADLRSAFGETASDQNYIRTIPKYGYQLVANSGSVSSTVEAPRRIGQLAVVLAVVAAAIAFVWMGRAGQPPTGAGQDWRLPPPRPLTADPGLEHQPRFTPGGDWVVYAALRPQSGDWDLFRISTGDRVSQSLAASPGIHEHGPAVAPDGERLAYVRMTGASCDVVIQALTFGVPTPVAACTSKFPTLVDWSPNGREIAFTGAERDDADGFRRLYIVDVESGETRRISKDVSPTGSDFYPRFSPSGQHIAFLRGEPQPDHRSSIWYVDTATGIESRVTAQPAQIGGMSWVDDRGILFSINDGGRFEIRRYDLDTGSTTLFDRQELIHPDYLPAADVLVASARRSERDIGEIGPDGAVSAVASSTSDDYHGRYSPGGRFVAFISRRTGYDEVWIAANKDQATRQLTRFDGATVRYPDWHPDGSRILFTVQTDTGEKLREIDVVSGTTRALGDDRVEATTPAWVKGGSAWVYGCNESGTWGICVGDENGARKIADGYYRPQPISADTVAVVDSAGVLYEMSLESGTTAPVWDGLPGNGRFGWTLSGGSLVYSTAGNTANTGRIVRRSLASGAETVVFEGPMPLADTAISIEPGSGRILFTRYDAASDDLVVFDRALGVQ